MEYDTLKKGNWIKKLGCLDSRLLLIKTQRGEFTTHVQVIQEDGTKSLIWGHYFQKVDDALEDYFFRLPLYTRD